MATAVIFGGTGFIGSFLAMELIESKGFAKIYLLDLKPICTDRFYRLLEKHIETGKIEYIACDVRQPISDQVIISDTVDLIANLAAIHREPGHEPVEYYETNIKGAEYVCQWSEQVGCQQLIFTSSIAPYGEANQERTEESIPVPITPYGGSKLAAEKIHQGWAKCDANRRLTIVRPGVVFGPGEGGNVSRLIKAVLKGYFIYTGNNNTQKAGIYVKELVKAMCWIHSLESRTNSIITNMTMDPAPSVKDYVDAIQTIANRRKFTPSIPLWSLLPAAFVLDKVAKLFNVNQPINPTRLKKVCKSNNITPQMLKQKGYNFEYDLLSAMKDWKNCYPKEWQ